MSQSFHHASKEEAMLENIDDPGMVVPDLGRRREKGQEWSRQRLPWVT